jgi:hypothetical protein
MAMNFAYLIPRIIRHFVPERLADWMKKKQFIIKAGIETMDPQVALKRYLDYFNEAQIAITNKKIMIFGYGGNIITACGLLKHGADKVILCERKGLPYPKLNDEVVSAYPNYFLVKEEGIQPDPDHLLIIHEDIRDLANRHNLQKVDLVLSTSVFEHLDDVDGITHALASLTAKQGEHVHFVDLRDHFFKYPFEMLTYSNKTWNNLLNPTSNLNRLRIPQYKSIFQKYFSAVKITVQESDIDSFYKIKPRIQKEFLSGDDMINSAMQIVIESSL